MRNSPVMVCSGRRVGPDMAAVAHGLGVTDPARCGRRMARPFLPYVSIIVPTYNDEARLGDCLEALYAQTYPRERYEVIVVDNGSERPLDHLVVRHPEVRIAVERKPGSYAARNHGIRLSRGDLLAFTDSDCIPYGNWIEQGVRQLLSQPGRGLLAGRIEVFSCNPAKPKAVELYEQLMAFPQQEYIEVYRFGVTANLFTTRTVLSRVGRFDDSLQSGGDAEWGRRVHAAGYELAYSPLVCVRHPARQTLGELHAKIRRVASGHRKLVSKPKRGLLARGRRALVAALPPWQTIRKIWFDAAMLRLRDKGRVVLVVLAVRYLRLWTAIQLTLSRSALGWRTPD